MVSKAVVSFGIFRVSWLSEGNEKDIRKKRKKKILNIPSDGSFIYRE
jgi:hypothetical protein